MRTEAVGRRTDAAVHLGEQPEAALTAVSQAREAINLRLLLELRRRLKAAAERELAIGADRMRRLRTDLRHCEAELRLFARALETRGQQLGRTLARLQSTQTHASQTSDRLAALDREHQDLARQLDAAGQQAARLQQSVEASPQVRHGTLDSLVLAAGALANDLAHAAEDQKNLRSRGRDLIDESQALAGRAGALHECFFNLARTTAHLSDEISAALDGLPARRPDSGLVALAADKGARAAT